VDNAARLFICEAPQIGSSQYTYAEASMSQSKEEIITSTENALYFFGEVPVVIVLDKLKSTMCELL
jgi:transposase